MFMAKNRPSPAEIVDNTIDNRYCSMSFSYEPLTQIIEALCTDSKAPFLKNRAGSCVYGANSTWLAGLGGGA
jgi:hypothetical protein